MTSTLRAAAGLKDSANASSSTDGLRTALVEINVNIAYEETTIQKLKMDLSAFEARDIYNIDETGSFYR